MPKLATLAALGLAGLLALGAVPAQAEPTLALVKKRGELLCGINGRLPGFSVQNGRKEWVGFEIDYCRAVAAATLGDGSKVRFVPLTAGVRDAVVVYVDAQSVVVPETLLGVAPGNGKMLGLEENWAYNAIKQVGNYAEIYERNVGKGSPLRFARGVNAL